MSQTVTTGGLKDSDIFVFRSVILTRTQENKINKTTCVDTFDTSVVGWAEADR